MQTIRPMTEIEQTLMQKVMDVLLGNLKESWKAVYAIDFFTTAMKTHRQMLQVAAPHDMVVHFKFHAQMRQTMAKFHLVIPTLVLTPIIHFFDQQPGSTKEINHNEALLFQLRTIPVNVTIETAETPFPIESLLSLQTGDTLVLDQRQDWPVHLKVCGRPKLQAVPRPSSSRKAFVVSTHSRPVREEKANGSIS
jgi:flagellar motor switch protein FliM